MSSKRTINKRRKILLAEKELKLTEDQKLKQAINNILADKCKPK